MQFSGYALFKWDLVGCLGLNTKKSEKKHSPNSLKGLSRKKRNDVGGGVDI